MIERSFTQNYVHPPPSGVSKIFLNENMIYATAGHDGFYIFNNTFSSSIISVPSTCILHQNYPNPFNPITTISYELPVAQYIKLQVFDITGRLVETLYHGYKEAGNWDVKWNAGNYSSGIYIYRLEYGDKHVSRKMVLMK